MLINAHKQKYYHMRSREGRNTKEFIELKTHEVCDLLTVNEGAIEPLNVIVFGEGEEDLATND